MGTIEEIAGLDSLRTHARTVGFDPGGVLRHKGHHYADAYVIVSGSVAVELGETSSARKIVLGRGAPVGEIGFVRGIPATATVTAVSPVEALYFDDDAVNRLEATEPQLAAWLLRLLATTASERLGENLNFEFDPAAFAKGGDIEIKLCRSDDMLAQVQRLRYEVYCGELGRKSPNADHEQKLLRDDLDRFAHVFFAEADGQAVATIRGNRPSEGDIGILGELYGMRHSPHYPDHNAIITKFVISKDYRGGAMALRMIAALVRYGEKYDIRECYIDCVPSLLPYYRAIGFKVCGEPFLHRENGLSIPMRLDLVRHGARLARDPTLVGMFALYAKAKLLKRLGGIKARFARPVVLPAPAGATP